MNKLIYNDQWIVCGHSITSINKNLEELFSSIQPDDRAIILVQNREVLSIYMKNAFIISTMVFMAALKSGVLRYPFSNADFCVLDKQTGLVLLPNVEPFNRVITEYQRGINIFGDSTIEMAILRTPEGEIPRTICPN